MNKLEQATKPATNFITFIYEDDTKDTTRNIETATAILDSRHESIRTVIWNGIKFTVQELLDAKLI
jgi:hypothetical protein